MNYFQLKKLQGALLPTFLLAPGIATAQTIDAILVSFAGFLLLLFPLVVALSLFVFLAGMARFIYESGDEEGRKRGRQVMIWGVVGLFISVTLWGIVAVFQGAFGLNPDESCGPPQLNPAPGAPVTTC